MKVLRQITYTGKNLDYMFLLPCVKAVLKVHAEPFLILWRDMVSGDNKVARPGDNLVQYSNGKWSVE